MGEYKREELPGLIRKYEIDLIGLFSIWRETFCYTLSEAVLCRVPLIVSDEGALGERVRQLGCGWVMPDCHDAAQIQDKINWLKGRPQEYLDCAARLQKLEIRSVEEMAARYGRLYLESMLAEGRQCQPFDPQLIFHGWASANDPSEGAAPGELRERLEKAELELRRINGSLLHRLADWAKELPVPGKLILKKMICDLYGRVKKA